MIEFLIGSITLSTIILIVALAWHITEPAYEITESQDSEAD